jgi:hypothetical protein
MPTTSEIRTWWSPACKAKAQSLKDAYDALDRWLKYFKYAPELGHTGAFNCRPITGGTAYSLHAYNPNGRYTFWSGVPVTMAIAVDINWRYNPYGKTLVTDMPPAMVAAIKNVRTNSGKQVWRWGGDYIGNKDAMHYEIICHPSDLASGINPATLPSSTPQPEPIPPATTTTTSGDGMFSTTIGPNNRIYEAMIGTDGGVYVRSGASLLELSAAGAGALGGKAKSINTYFHNGTWVVSVHGLNDEIAYNAFANGAWSGWFGSQNIKLHGYPPPA